MNEHVHAPRFLGREVLGHVEALNFAGDTRLERRGVEAADPDNATGAGDDVPPGIGDVVAHRRNGSQTGDDDSATRQGDLQELEEYPPSSFKADRLPPGTQAFLRLLLM
jgi:hypothetical protein